MPRLLIALLMLPFLIGCSEKTEPGKDENPEEKIENSAEPEKDSGQPESDKLSLPPSTTDEQLAEKLKGRANLKHLVLSYKITDSGMAHLKGLTNLKTLKLVETPITDVGMAHLKGITTLERLSLWRTKVTDAGLIHLKGLAKLEELDLGWNNLTDAGLVYLKGLTKLKVLSLALIGEKITDDGIAHLKGLSNLEKLLFLKTGGYSLLRAWETETHYSGGECSYRGDSG